MTTAPRPRITARCAILAACLLCGLPQARAQDAAALQARHGALAGPLASNPFRRPLVIESSEDGSAVKGEIYAELSQPFAVAGAELAELDHWCDILILHLNVKACRATAAPAPLLSLNVGRKFDQPLADAYLFQFAYRVLRSGPDYLSLRLDAPAGPLGTSDYRIALEAVPLDAGRSFLHLSYTLHCGLAARAAMRGYLATLGRGKRGFSVVGRGGDGQPEYIGGIRGAVERNSMRYYLAIEAYLGALAAPPPRRLELRLNAWQTGVERYPAQLHEMERAEYLEMKRKEIRRQLAAQ